MIEINDANSRYTITGGIFAYVRTAIGVVREVRDPMAALGVGVRELGASLVLGVLVLVNFLVELLLAVPARATNTVPIAQSRLHTPAK
jgi:hypothetical protein